MAKLDREAQINLYTLVSKARKLEEKLIELSTGGLIPGWVHSGLGQEATGVAVTVNLNKNDYINITHRGRPAMLGKGVSLKNFLAEAMGKKDGPCKGKSGEGHFADMEKNIIGGSGIIGASLPICAGVATACKLKKTGQIVVCFFGDGAADEGAFHETLNLASKWELPIIFVCENNGWAQFVPQTATSALMSIAKRADAYNMTSESVDGNDVLKVYNVAKEAVVRARNMQPTLIEVKVNRWLGHYVGDSQKYRDADEIEDCKKDDFLEKYRSYLLKNKVLTKGKIKNIEENVEIEIKEAVEYALGCELPDNEVAFEDVYC